MGLERLDGGPIAGGKRKVWGLGCDGRSIVPRFFWFGPVVQPIDDSDLGTRLVR